MAVYVDPLFATPGRAPRWPFAQACHMMADTDDELHAFARRLGLRREWHQACPPHSHSHYDLTANKRRRAVQLGALEVDRRFVAGRCRARLHSDAPGPKTLIDEAGEIIGGNRCP